MEAKKPLHLRVELPVTEPKPERMAEAAVANARWRREEVEVLEEVKVDGHILRDLETTSGRYFEVVGPDGVRQSMILLEAY